MPDARKEKLAAAKRKLRKFKQNRGKEGKLHGLKDDSSSIASEDSALFDVTEKPIENGEEKDTSLTSYERIEINQSSIAEDATAREKDLSSEANQNKVCEQDTTRTESENLQNGAANFPYADGSSEITNEGDKPINIKPTDEDNFNSEALNRTETNPDITSYAETVSENLSPNTHDKLNKGDYSVGNNQLLTEEDLPVLDKEKNSIANTSDLSTTESELSSTATTEKLLQISTKLNGLAAEAQSVASSTNGDSPSGTADRFVLTELEHRNQQLAEQVATVTRQRQELLLQVEKLTKQMSELHHRLEAEKQQIYAHGINEQNALRQQLQVQMQTIGILVAEKQELQHQVHEARAAATQDQNSRQRCQDQLQDAKLRLQTLEREIKNNEDSIQLLTTSKADVVKERDQLQILLSKASKSSEENNMHTSELSQKLQTKEEECKRLGAELDDLHEKLSMAEVLLQQLSNTSGVSAESQVQQLQEERESLNQKLIEVKVALDLYQQAFEQLTGEREQLSRQYEDVNKQMETQVTELSQQVNLLEKEKAEIQAELEDVQHNLDGLRLENKQNEQDTDSDQARNRLNEMSSKLEEIKSELDTVYYEKEELNQKLYTQIRNNETLGRLNEEKELQVEELSRNISESVLSADEHTRLLEQSQSDKATISRALTQNKQLKQQLEEMHDGFIKLSNDKMELATELTTVQHTRSELEEDIGKYKLMLQDFEQKLANKEQDIDEMHTSMSQPSPVEEASEPTNDTSLIHVQNELLASQETVAILGEQNNELKSMITKLQTELDTLHNASRSETSSHEDVFTIEHEQPSQATPQVDTSMVDVLNASVQQLEEEREMLTRKFEEQRQQHGALMEQFLLLQQSQQENHNVSVEDHDELQRNMNLLQDRFSTVMKEKVDALSKIEDLEHINLQLQNECDTIGEYITLYHNQRQILKQRHHEKDEYVSSMAQEREEMQQKLEKLQNLVLTLLNSRGINSTSVPLTSSPRKHVTDGAQLGERVIAGLKSEWPDMLEEEEEEAKSDRKPRPDLLPDPASLPEHHESESESESESEPAKPSDRYPGKLQRIEGADYPENESSTANKIINLLEQMQKPNESNATDVPRGFCLRYMGPYTAI